MRKSRPILNVTTGKVYPTMAEAAADVGINYKGISNVVNGDCRTAGGYEWRYADETL